MTLITLDKAIKKFVQHQHATGLAEGTQSQYAYLLAQWGRALDKRPLHWQKTKQDDIEDFLEEYRKTHSKSSTALFGTSLQSFYKWAERKRHVHNSPARKLDPIKRNKRLPRPIPAWHIERLLEGLNSPNHDVDKPFMDEWHRNRMIILTFLYTGLRLAELAALTWDVVDLTSCTITVIGGKGDKDRVVPIAAILLTELQLWSKGRYSGVMFVSMRGGPLSKHVMSKMFRRFVRDHLGLQCTAHRLRHSFATMIVEQGGDIRKLQKMLGHAQLNTTALYAEVSDKGMHETAALLNEAWKMKKDK